MASTQTHLPHRFGKLIRLLYLLLILAFFMPAMRLYGPDAGNFVIPGLSGFRAASFMQFLHQIWPLLALGLVFAAGRTQNMGKKAVLLAFSGSFTLLATLIGLLTIYIEGVSSIHWLAYLGAIMFFEVFLRGAILLLVIGVTASSFCPTNRSARSLLGIGGILFLLFLLIDVLIPPFSSLTTDLPHRLIQNDTTANIVASFIVVPAFLAGYFAVKSFQKIHEPQIYGRRIMGFLGIAVMVLFWLTIFSIREGTAGLSAGTVAMAIFLNLVKNLSAEFATMLAPALAMTVLVLKVESQEDPIQLVGKDFAEFKQDNSEIGPDERAATILDSALKDAEDDL